MLPFPNQFNNDNPLSNLEELLTLNTWYAAIFLVIGNLAGIAPFLYALLLGLYVLAYSILMSLIISCFYHLCQTTHECFQLILPLHISIDHFTSTSMMGLAILAFFNVRTVCQLATTRRLIKVMKQRILSITTSPTSCRPKIKKTPYCLMELISEDPASYVKIEQAPDVCRCGEERHHHFTYGKVEENMIYDAWTAGSAITVITVTVVAVYAHPFSYAAFNIVIAVTFPFLAFIKVMLIDEGQPTNFIGRVSVPELIISIILGIIGLTAYVLDAYCEYMILHSVWHVSIYISLLFFLAGTMKSVNGWVPLWDPFYRRVFNVY